MSSPKLLLVHEKPTAYICVHKNQAIVKAHFAFDREIIALVRNLEGARWSQTLQSWYFPKADFNLNTLYQSCKGKVFIDYSRLKQASLPIKKTVSEPPKPIVNIPKQTRLKP